MFQNLRWVGRGMSTRKGFSSQYGPTNKKEPTVNKKIVIIKLTFWRALRKKIGISKKRVQRRALHEIL